MAKVILLKCVMWRQTWFQGGILCRIRATPSPQLHLSVDPHDLPGGQLARRPAAAAAAAASFCAWSSAATARILTIGVEKCLPLTAAVAKDAAVRIR